MGMKTHAFNTGHELALFVNNAANNVVVGKFTILYDVGSEKYVLFWWA